MSNNWWTKKDKLFWMNIKFWDSAISYATSIIKLYLKWQSKWMKDAYKESLERLWSSRSTKWTSKAEDAAEYHLPMHITQYSDCHEPENTVSARFDEQSTVEWSDVLNLTASR